MLPHRLSLKGISISIRSACDSVNTQASPVIQAICVPPEDAEGILRGSPGRDSKEENAAEAANVIGAILRK